MQTCEFDADDLASHAPLVAAIEAAHGPLGAIGLPQAKFLRPLLPGERAEVSIEGEAPRWRFRVLRGEALIASGEVALA